jgi:hypothetical protein
VRCGPAAAGPRGRRRSGPAPAASLGPGAGGSSGSSVPTGRSQSPARPSAAAAAASPAAAQPAAAAAADAAATVVAPPAPSGPGGSSGTSLSSYEELTFLPDDFTLPAGQLSAVDRASPELAEDVFRCPGCTNEACMVRRARRRGRQ